MIKYLSVSIKEPFVAPLNDSELHYYSLMSDGFSSAKTMDEIELVLIKTCQNGLPKCDVLRLIEPEEGDQHGIKKAINSAVSSASFSFQRAERDIGICTDTAAVTIAAYRLTREELGEHYLLMLCPAHTLELAIKDAFTAIGLDSKCNDDYTSIYYLCKKANVKWRLMKRQGIFMHIPVTRYNRPSGTRWVEHQVAALKSHLKNVPIFIGFCDQQILTPHKLQ